MNIFDSLRNVVANLGTSRDKAALSTYAFDRLDYEQLLAAYRGAWLPRKIVDIPAFDACRKWRTWTGSSDHINAIEAEERRLSIREKLLRAIIAARLYGGSALYIGTDDPDPSEPFEPTRVRRGGVRYLTVLTPRKLLAGPLDLDPASEWFNQPSYWTMSDLRGGLVRIHPSRLVILRGAELPDDYDHFVTGWGDSVLQSVMQAVKHADATAANVASLVFEAKVDVIRVPGLMMNVGATAYREKLLERFGLAATAKGINGALLLDKEEEYEQKSASFATLPEIMDRFYQAVSGAADIPMTRLFGMSPGGLNATGDSDIRNYYDRISSIQELEINPAMARMDEALLHSALGVRPEDVYASWASLWQTTETERANIGEVTARTLNALSQSGLFPPEALSKAGTNALVEVGALPGLESAMEEFEASAETDLEEDQDVNDPPALTSEITEPEPTLSELADALPRALYVSRKVLNAREILDWAEQQGISNLTEEDDLHVSLVYSRAPVDWLSFGQSYEPTLEIPEGGPRVLEKFGEALVLSFASDALSWRHAHMVNLGASHDYESYQPHITLTYSAEADAILADATPYSGRIVLGPEMFEPLKENFGEVPG